MPNNADAESDLANTIAQDIGVKPAINRIITRAEKGENRWRMMMASLLQLDNDPQGAITWLQKIIDDPKSTAQEIDNARRAMGVICLRLEPPGHQPGGLGLSELAGTFA